MGYINALPVEWGLEAAGLDRLVDIKTGPPTELNDLLARGELDLSPVSTAAALEHADDWLVVDDFCIGSHQRVASVVLVSQVPVEELDGRSIGVTPESATSVKLLEILLREHWKVKANLVDIEADTPAKLHIGDSALRIVWGEAASPMKIYDLAEAWHRFTGLGFAFGLWCIRREFVRENPDQARALCHLLALSRELSRVDSSAAVELGRAKLYTGPSREAVAGYFDLLKHDLDDSISAGIARFVELLGYPGDRLRYYNPKDTTIF